MQTAFHVARTHWPNSNICVVLFNAGFAVWKPFMQITEDEDDKVTDTNVKVGFAFAREVVSASQAQASDEKRGMLLFTGTTPSLLGITTTAVFLAARFACCSPDRTRSALVKCVDTFPVRRTWGKHIGGPSNASSDTSPTRGTSPSPGYRQYRDLWRGSDINHTTWWV